MKNYVELGDDLYIEDGDAYPYGMPDMTMAHMHPGYELLMVLDPISYSTVIDGKIFRGKGPMAMLIAPYCMHFTYYTDSELRGKKFMAFYAGDEYIDGLGDEAVPLRSMLGSTNARIFDISGHEEQLGGIMAYILAEHAKRDTLADRSIKNASMTQKLLFAALLNMLDGAENKAAAQNASDGKDYIADVIMYIAHNLNKKINTPDIADKFFVSRDKLNRDFKKRTHMTIKEFMTHARINLAKSRLQEGKYSIQDISMMCGFESERYFYSFFKQNTGITPREFSRNTHQ
ncbi:MAG: helix-turn-helix transcriptional regulator [Clostridia bacterium]|nr:helix-turn-helix transcriptional regulator [Clostridia bacterium]